MRPRMCLEVDLLQLLAREVGVELGGREVGVAEHLLDRAEVATARQQMGGEGVAEGVRAHLSLQPSRVGVAKDDLVEALASQRPAAEVEEELRLVRLPQQPRAPGAQV